MKKLLWAVLIASIGATASAADLVRSSDLRQVFFVAAATAPVASISVASTAEVTVATVTATVKAGGRPYLFEFTMTLTPSTAKTYTIRLREEGSLISPAWTHDIGSGSNAMLSGQIVKVGGAAASGVRNFQITVQSSAATGTQTASAIQGSFVEF